jgi:hypothetical protein
VKEITIYNSLLIAWFAAAAITFITLFFIVAPYGRHARKGWGYSIKNKMAWVIMEAPSPIVFALCFFFGDIKLNVVTLIFLRCMKRTISTALLFILSACGARKSACRYPSFLWGSFSTS